MSKSLQSKALLLVSTKDTPSMINKMNLKQSAINVLVGKILNRSKRRGSKQKSCSKTGKVMS